MLARRTVDYTALICAWVLEGRSDEKIAGTFSVSVKVVRLVRGAVEAAVRPRGIGPPARGRPRRRSDRAAWPE